MPQQDGEEYVLVVGAAGNCLAEFDVAMFWPFDAEVLSPAEKDDFSELLYNRLYSMSYNIITYRQLHLQVVQNAVLLLEVPT